MKKVRALPGEYAGPAGGFPVGRPLDAAAGGLVLLGLAKYADGFTGSSDVAHSR